MLRIDSIENVTERFGPPFIELEEGIQAADLDGDGSEWVAAWVRLRCADVDPEEFTFSKAAKRPTGDQKIIFPDPPILVDEDGMSLPDTAISGDPEQRGLVACWIPVC